DDFAPRRSSCKDPKTPTTSHDRSSFLNSWEPLEADHSTYIAVHEQPFISKFLHVRILARRSFENRMIVFVNLSNNLPLHATLSKRLNTEPELLVLFRSYTDSSIASDISAVWNSAERS
ncbi:hypothetical protein BUE80_DR002230, partial [Diplocarpon rosae]